MLVPYTPFGVFYILRSYMVEITNQRTRNLKNLRFGKLIVVEFAGYKNKRAEWLCKCDCGNDICVPAHRLISGNTKSCGCYMRESVIKRKTTHGGSKRKQKERLYNIWNGMKNRCFNEKDKNYKNYGARGIKVCDEWQNDYVSFRKWAIENGYKSKLSIDRINNNGNYCPENCRWATKIVQNNNTRQNHYIEYNGERKTVSEWARFYGLTRECLKNRIQKGWETERALKTPSRNKNKKQKFKDFLEGDNE
jgi:hypothetical protein